MRDSVSTCVELLGFGCLVVAGLTISLTAGLVVAGVALILVGYLTGRR